MSIDIEHVTQATDDARLLVGELEAEMARHYDANQRHGLKIEDIFRPDLVFLVARLDGSPAGCGGVAFDDGFAELKRMFVRPAVRGRGVVDALLVRLEAEARGRGYRRLALETGDVQLAALKVYARAGFVPCAAFGSYVGKPPEDIVRSVFLEKMI
jgi:putative acetyltransferase